MVFTLKSTSKPPVPTADFKKTIFLLIMDKNFREHMKMNPEHSLVAKGIKLTSEQLVAIKKLDLRMLGSLRIDEIKSKILTPLLGEFNTATPGDQ